MGKDKRTWRKLVKKLRRKKLRRKFCPMDEVDEMQEEIEVDDLAEDIMHSIEEQKWLQREKIAQEDFVKKQEAIKRELENNEAREKEEKKLKEERRKDEEEKMKKKVQKMPTYISSTGILYFNRQLQRYAFSSTYFFFKDEEFHQLLDFLSGDLETPPVASLIPETYTDGKVICGFFSKTGICKFFSKCSRFHAKPMLSQVILISNFFSHFFIEQSVPDKYDADLSLEFEDSEIYNHFVEFYNDVLPEFKKYGKVIQFKVCANFEPHLRGNVYVQYENIREALQAFRVFNGRFYNGKQLTLSFVNINSWKSAICGLHSRRKCPKGELCNFLHVFRNPTKEFVNADYDRVSKLISEIENKNKGILSTNTTEKEISTRKQRWSSHSPESDSDKKQRSKIETLRTKRHKKSSRKSSSSERKSPNRHSRKDREKSNLSSSRNSSISASVVKKSPSFQTRHNKHKVKKSHKHKHKYKKDKRKS